MFVADFTTEQSDARDYLRQWVNEIGGGEVLRAVPSPLGDFSDDPGLPSHNWSPSSMARVGQAKNRILRKAIELKADAVWLVDADLILDKTTLKSLIAADRPVSCGVYWTHWQRATGNESIQLHAGPQVWLNHPYEMNGRGMEDWEFRGKLVRRELTQVWGQGACTLIDRRVVEAGINFDYVPEIPLQGLMAGEDRHFCLWAERGHLPMFADAWPDIFHIYHRPEDELKIPAMLERLGTDHPMTPQLGDLVSLLLQPLEPLPTPRGMQQLSPHPVRGRLGQIPLMPELEEAVYHLTRGQTVTVRVHCPVSHPIPYYRGRARLYRVTLVDCKPFGHPPVLENEMFVGPKSKAVHDMALLSPQQIEGLKEMVG